MFAQSGAKYSVDGNFLSNSDWLGSKNAVPLIIKVNNTQRALFTSTGFDVYGNIHSTKNMMVDSILTSWQVMVDDALSVGGTLSVSGDATINGNATVNGTFKGGQISINGSSITSLTGSISFGNDNLTTAGNVSASNISTLQSIVGIHDSLIIGHQSQLAFHQTQLALHQGAIDSLQSAVSNHSDSISNLSAAQADLTSQISNLTPTQWENDTVTNSTIFYTGGNVGIGTSHPSEPLEVNGRIKVTGSPSGTDSTGNPVPPAPGTSQSIIIDGGIDRITATSGTLDFDNTNLTTSGNIQSASITTANLTISDKIVTKTAEFDTLRVAERFEASKYIGSDTLHALKSLEVNNSLRLTKETTDTYAEVSTKDTAVMLVLQKAEAGQVVIGPVPPMPSPIPLPGLVKDKLTVIGNTRLEGQLNVSGNVNAANISALQFSVDSMQLTIIDISGQVTDLSGQVDTLQNEMLNVQYSMLNVQSAITAQDTAIGALNDTLLNLQFKFSNLNSSQWKNDTLNSGNIYYDGGKIGIGTSAPAAKLDVFGSQRITGNLFVGGELSVSDKFSAQTIVTDTIKPTPTGAAVHVAAPMQATAIRVDTLSVSEKFTAENSISSDTMLAMQKAYINHNLILGSDSGSTQSDIASRAEALKIQSDPNATYDVLMSADNNTKVGIGDKNPTEKLSVQGNVKVSGDIISAGNITTMGVISASAFSSEKFSSDTLFVTRIMPAVGDSEIHIGDSSIVINGITNSIKTIKKGSNGSLFLQNQPLTPNTPDFDATNNTILNPFMGNVGIGTTNPSEKLDVAGFIKSSSLAGSGNNMVIADATGKLGILPLTGGGNPNWSVTGNSGTNATSNFIGTADAADLVIKTNNVERMRITSTGEHPGLIGIGTNNPEKAFHIKTTHTFGFEPPIPACFPGSQIYSLNCPAIATAEEEGSHNGLRLEDVTTFAGGGIVQTKWDILPAFDRLIIGKADASASDYNDVIGTQPKVIINADGKVGIGGDPKEMLQIGNTFTFHDGGNKVIARNFYFDGQDKRIEQGKAGAIYFGDGTISVRVAPNDALDAQINWVSAIDVINNGNVGIGTTNPQTKLDVNGDIRIGSLSGTGNNLIKADNDGKLSSVSFNDAGFGFWQTTNGNDIYHLNGKVGIGTSEPAASLHVKGKVVIGNLPANGEYSNYQLAVDGRIVSTRATVQIDQWGDYVFEKNYNQLTLDELKKKIDEFGRLPNMPSEKEIKKKWY